MSGDHEALIERAQRLRHDALEFASRGKQRAPTSADKQEAVALREGLASLLNDVQQLDATVELPPELREGLAQVDVLISNWDRLVPFWSRWGVLTTEIARLPRTPENLPRASELASEMKRLVEEHRSLLPEGEAMLKQLEVLLRALPTAEPRRSSS
ncbi:MAG TPA: hypothetical protein VK689_22490 [Armatimonadota bacterium]|nr:hypothetical protein [Armatimonadota bacterium]